MNQGSTGERFEQRLVTVNRNALYIFGDAINKRDFREKDYRDNHIVSIDLTSLFT